MYKQLMDECNRIKIQCWQQRMAAARFMDNLEDYQEGRITKEQLLCFMPDRSVDENTRSLTVHSSTQVRVVSAIKRAA